MKGIPFFYRFLNPDKSPNSSMITRQGHLYKVKHPKQKPKLFWDSSRKGTYYKPVIQC